jgi:hypothetical protein
MGVVRLQAFLTGHSVRSGSEALFGAPAPPRRLSRQRCWFFDWPSIGAELDAFMTMVLKVLLVAVVALEAEALQRAVQEGPPVTLMRRDVISDGSCYSQATFGTHTTNRFVHQVTSASTPPAFELIPIEWVVVPRCYAAWWHG